MTSDKLTVFKELSSVFTDVSDEVFNYIVDSTMINLNVSDFIYVGFEKPFYNLYAELSVFNALSTTISVEYNTSSGFTSVPNLTEETNGFERSGFIKWGNTITDWEASTVNSVELFWARISVSSLITSTTTLDGLNIVFANDNDLAEEYRRINSFRDSNDSSFIAIHQSIRKKIVQKIRNQGNAKRSRVLFGNIDVNIGDIKNMTQWDLLDIDEIREAAKFYALEKIFNNASDSVDGKFQQLATQFKRSGDEAFQVFLLTLDKDDDGIVDPDEASVQFSRSIRV